MSGGLRLVVADEVDPPVASVLREELCRVEDNSWCWVTHEGH